MKLSEIIGFLENDGYLFIHPSKRIRTDENYDEKYFGKICDFSSYEKYETYMNGEVVYFTKSFEPKMHYHIGVVYHES